MSIMLACLTIASSAVSAGRYDPTGERLRTPAVERLEIDVVLDPAAERMTGVASYQIRIPESDGTIVFEIGEAMEIVEVASPAGEGAIGDDRRSVVIEPEAGVDAGEPVSVTIRFRTRERSSQIVVAPDGALASWAETWYPITGSEWAAPGVTRITVPAGWRTISNGRLDETRREGDATTEVWVSERPAARSFAAARYTITTRRVGDREVGVYLLDHADRAEALLGALTATLESLEARFGAYPYPGYAVAEVPADLVDWTGSSEQGFFMARSDALDGPPNLPLIAHELAHGWWGNWVRAVMPGQLMVGEALAQYGAVVAIEAIEGADAAIEFLRFSREGYNPIQSASGFWRLKIAGHDRPLAELAGDGADHNLADAKGHWVYHMLRRQVGGDVFFGTLRGILDDRGGGTLSLPDLRAAFVGAAPDVDLETFFKQWLDRSGAPVLSTEWRDVSEAGRYAVEIDVRQRTPRPYTVPLTIGVTSDSGTRLHRVSLTDRAHTFTLEADGPPTGIVENADHALLIWESAYVPP